jgi:hypothetical protein
MRDKRGKHSLLDRAGGERPPLRGKDRPEIKMRETGDVEVRPALACCFTTTVYIFAAAMLSTWI